MIDQFRGPPEWEKMTGASVTLSASLIVAGRDVGQVHQHAQPVHLPDDLLAESGEPAMALCIQGGIGPVEGHVMGQRHVPHAHVVVGPQGAEGVLDRVSPLQRRATSRSVRRRTPGASRPR